MNNASFDFDAPRLLPPRGLLISLLAQLPLVVVSWPLRPSIIEIVVGALLVSLGVLLNVWSAKIFEAGEVGVCPFTPAPILIRRGPYRFTRNPMYVGLVCVTLGAAVLTGVMGNIWIAAAFFIWLHWGYVVPEERWLRKNFGEVFDDYAKRVPQWLIR